MNKFVLYVSLTLATICGAATHEDLQRSISNLKAAVDNMSATNALVNELMGALFNKPLSINLLSKKATKGSTVNVPVIFASGPKSISAIQFDVRFPAGIVYADIVPGPETINVQKNVQASPIAGGIKVIIFGINQTTFGRGVLATIKFNVSSLISTGPKPLTFANVIGSDPDGVTVPLATTNGTIDVE